MAVIRNVGDIVPGMRLVEAEAFGEGGHPFTVHGPFIALPEEELATMSDDLRDGTGHRGPKYRAPLVGQCCGIWSVRVVREEEYLELKRQGAQNPARGQFELRIPNIGEDGKEETPFTDRRRNRLPQDFSHLHTADDLERLSMVNDISEYRKLLA